MTRETYLKEEQVEAVRALLVRPDLASHFADVVIASAVLTGQTPRQVLAQALDRYPISDEQWTAIVRPELAYAADEEPTS